MAFDFYPGFHKALVALRPCYLDSLRYSGFRKETRSFNDYLEELSDRHYSLRASHNPRVSHYNDASMIRHKIHQNPVLNINTSILQFWKGAWEGGSTLRLMSWPSGGWSAALIS